MADVEWDIACRSYSQRDGVVMSCRTLCQGKRGFSSSLCSSICPSNNIPNIHICIYMCVVYIYIYIYHLKNLYPTSRKKILRNIQHTQNTARISQRSSSSVSLHAHHSVHSNARNAGVRRLIVTHGPLCRRNI